MKPIERHRRDLIRRGMDPDCMPDGYWQKYAAKRKASKLAPRKPKGGCKSCRLITDPEAL